MHTCITSPPYFWQRDYGVDGQIGHEDTPEAFVQALVSVFREVRRVLREDGTLWLNLGDSYYNGNGQPKGSDPRSPSRDWIRKKLGLSMLQVLDTQKSRYSGFLGGWPLRCRQTGGLFVRRLFGPEKLLFLSRALKIDHIGNTKLFSFSRRLADTN